MCNLEKKLQYIEQNNHALRQVVDAHRAKTDYSSMKEQVNDLVFAI